MSEVWADILKEKLLSIDNQNITIRVNPSQINFVWGYGGSNKALFEGKGIHAKIVGDNRLEKYEVQVSCC